MSLAQVQFPPPTPRGLDEWSLAHVDSHRRILQGIKAKKGLVLPLYIIFPINQNDFNGWLEQHSQQHGDMCSALGVTQNDLGDVDFNDRKQTDSWFFLHYTEHRNCELSAGVT